MIVELKEKAKKYKRMWQDQADKMQALDRKISVLEAASLGNQIDSEMDKEMGQL